jgi:hypothetical protein
MLLTITLTEPPATDLGFLLHKHPDRMQSFDVSAGQAHVFYPEAGEQRCTAALLLEIDPIGLVRGHRRAGTGGPEAFSLAEYVNDRPCAASSMLAVAREYALGLEALDRGARGEPLWRVHEAVFAVLALESEPVDPRL